MEKINFFNFGLLLFFQVYSLLLIFTQKGECKNEFLPASFFVAFLLLRQQIRIPMKTIDIAAIAEMTPIPMYNFLFGSEN